MKRLTENGYERVAAKFKVLANPGRLRILDLLRRRGELCVGDIALALNTSQPTASRQLAKLYEDNVVARRRQENTVFYFIADLSIFALCEVVCGRIESESEVLGQSLYEQDEESP